MDKEKEPTNLMPAKPEKLLSKTLTEHLTLFTNFLQVRKKFLRKLGEEMARGHSKKYVFSKLSIFDPLPPCLSLFILHVHTPLNECSL